MRVENKHMQGIKVRELNYETKFPHHQQKSSFYATYFSACNHHHKIYHTLLWSYVIYAMVAWLWEDMRKAIVKGKLESALFSSNVYRKNRKTFHRNFLQHERERAEKKLLSERKISIQPKRRQREAYDVILRHISANLTVFHMENREILKFFFPCERPTVRE